MKGKETGKPVVNGRVPKVLFVCLGNICRSTAAQAVLESLARERAFFRTVS